ncbi:MAG: hypothetical protein RBR24_01260 [Candidatus Carbobacillus sp.]|nr:hypothetical protein [Candidatus Carbobacillus sp.]
MGDSSDTFGSARPPGHRLGGWHSIYQLGSLSRSQNYVTSETTAVLPLSNAMDTLAVYFGGRRSHRDGCVTRYRRRAHPPLVRRMVHVIWENMASVSHHRSRHFVLGGVCWIQASDESFSDDTLWERAEKGDILPLAKAIVIIAAVESVEVIGFFALIICIVLLR